ncbi:MAG: pirin family protein [Candidatus Brocadia sp. WS118]|nr:MAG: pirin family protein [Candidatus Brocadia sp. WS118]
MITIRKPEDIYQAEGDIQSGTFHGRWHFSFDEYHDPEYLHFGTLRVFNDDTLSPGAVWPLHYHREIEVVTYCAGGEFRHADEDGEGGVLKKGWVQHTTVGKGMYHSEINHRRDESMRFIQMWFFPSEPGLKPSVEQKRVECQERTNRFLPLVSNRHEGALPIHSNAQVHSSFLQAGRIIDYHIGDDHGVYLYVLEGGPVQVNNHLVTALGAAKVVEETIINVRAETEAELILVDVHLL